MLLVRCTRQHVEKSNYQTNTCNTQRKNTRQTKRGLNTCNTNYSKWPTFAHLVRTRNHKHVQWLSYTMRTYRWELSCSKTRNNSTSLKTAELIVVSPLKKCKNKPLGNSFEHLLNRSGISSKGHSHLQSFGRNVAHGGLPKLKYRNVNQFRLTIIKTGTPFPTGCISLGQINAGFSKPILEENWLSRMPSILVLVQ